MKVRPVGTGLDWSGAAGRKLQSTLRLRQEEIRSEELQGALLHLLFLLGKGADDAIYE